MKVCNEVIGNLLTSKFMKDLKETSIAFPQKSILVICLNDNNLKILQENYKNSCIRIISFNALTNELSKKNFNYLHKKRISDFEAVTIIHSFLKKEFILNNAMKNLGKSDYFARELYNLFGLFKVNGFNEKKLFDLSPSFSILNEDKERFNLVLKVYKTYSEFLDKNNLVDYKDIVLTCLEFLRNNINIQNYYKNNYSHIFVESAQYLTTIQLDLIKLLTYDDKLFLYGDKNAQIQTFMGANAFSSKHKLETKNARNQEILQRALFLKGDFLNSTTSEAIKYLLCSDLQNEVEFIAKDIINGITNGLKYSDFAILLRDNSIKPSLIDMLKKYEIPVNSELQSTSFQHFKFKMLNILNLCEILENLKLKSIKENSFSSLYYTSQVDLSLYAQKCNLFFKNIIIDVFENKFIIEKFEKTMEENLNIFLLDVIFQNDFLLNAEEKSTFYSFIEKLDEIYQLFCIKDFVSIALRIKNMVHFDNNSFDKLFASFLSNLINLYNLNKNILKENIQINSILDLLNISVENTKENYDAVNILTFMNSAGLEYERIYIPSLIENYFPKKIKTTQFISEFANEQISSTLSQINETFDKVILSDKDELKKEEDLLYVALTSAKEKAFLLSHRYEQKKMVLPSPFFEQFMFADECNFISYELEKINAEDNKADFEKKEIDILPVLDKDETITLSASSISTFLSCPQKFYYQNLLNLKTESSYEANYGSIVHAVLEILLSKYLKEFSATKMKKLGSILFDVTHDQNDALNLGFSKEIIASILKLNKLNLEEMKVDFFNAVDSLEMKGFFTTRINFAECEKRFKFVLEKIPNVTFKGFIDTIYQTDLGDFLIDYKTSKTDKQKLSNIFSREGVNFLKNTGEFSESKLKKYEYQMPLYYLACLYSDDLKNKENLLKIGYQYVRPNSLNGATSDFIYINEIEEFKDKIIDNIKRYIVDEIYKTINFKPQADYMLCKKCDFSNICSSADLQGEENE